MRSSFRHTNVRLAPAQWDHIAALAAERRQTPAELIREAVDVYLGATGLLTSSHRRLARLAEFMQLALDVIISEQYPEFRERIIANTDRRLEQFHGA